jgi:hypothetical protein
VIFSVNGQIVNTPFTGTYRVSPHCSIAEAITFGSQVRHQQGVIVNGATEIDFIATDPGAVLSRVAKRGIGATNGEGVLLDFPLYASRSKQFQRVSLSKKEVRWPVRPPRLASVPLEECMKSFRIFCLWGSRSLFS